MWSLLLPFLPLLECHIKRILQYVAVFRRTCFTEQLLYPFTYLTEDIRVAASVGVMMNKAALNISVLLFV